LPLPFWPGERERSRATRVTLYDLFFTPYCRIVYINYYIIIINNDII
jgi:hypothetical protein